MATAKDVMTPKAITISQRAPILDAVGLLADHRISGLPVVDGEGNLVGILTEKDVLRLLVDQDPDKRFVEDYMTRQVKSFHLDDDIIEICKFFIKSAVRRVPIVDDDGKLAGVMSRRDLISEIKRIKGI